MFFILFLPWGEEGGVIIFIKNIHTNYMQFLFLKSKHPFLKTDFVPGHQTNPAKVEYKLEQVESDAGPQSHTPGDI